MINFVRVCEDYRNLSSCSWIEKDKFIEEMSLVSSKDNIFTIQLITTDEFFGFLGVVVGCWSIALVIRQMIRLVRY